MMNTMVVINSNTMFNQHIYLNITATVAGFKGCWMMITVGAVNFNTMLDDEYRGGHLYSTSKTFKKI